MAEGTSIRESFIEQAVAQAVCQSRLQRAIGNELQLRRLHIGVHQGWLRHSAAVNRTAK